MFPALRPLLNKGGAGRYISRQESIERLIPIAERHLDLLMGYSRALAGMPDGPAKERITAMMPYLRTEISKINESILSLGGTPPMGAGRRPDAPDTARPLRERVDGLLRSETAFGAALTDEAEAVHHQERTRAILNHNAAASASRVDLLRAVVADLPPR